MLQNNLLFRSAVNNLSARVSNGVKRDHRRSANYHNIV